MENLYKKVADIIKENDNIIFFGGAGVSTECGIPDFRSINGLYNQNYKYDYSPETILSYQFFKANPHIFYEFVNENIMKFTPSPNKGHRALAELEKIGKLKAVITQNIDNLHQMAGSRNVIELHGNLNNFYCSNCSRPYSPEIARGSNNVPKCECGGIIRPDIVLYEEALKEDLISKAIDYIKNADVLIVAGTSLTVYPAAGLLKYFKGKKLIIINKDKTKYDNLANIKITEPFSQFMVKVMLELKIWSFKTYVTNITEDYNPHPSFHNVDILPILPESMNLGIRSQYAKLKPNGKISPHVHDVVEVFTVIKGTPHVLIDGDWCLVNEGATIVAYPGELHGVKNNTSTEIVIAANFKC